MVDSSEPDQARTAASDDPAVMNYFCRFGEDDCHGVNYDQLLDKAATKFGKKNSEEKKDDKSNTN